MRVVALIAAYNEERYMTQCLEHLFRHGVEAYLIDNESTDRTVAIAEQYLGRGLIGIETMSRARGHILREKLERKEELAFTLEAEWFMHMDADEFRLPPRPDQTLAQALAEVEAQGYNAVNFLEFVFIPTQESPNHEHTRFQETMRRYYPFMPAFPHRLNAWKRQSGRVDLASSGGHRVSFPGLKMCPQSFRMRHYHFLSVEHAVAKLVGRPYAPEELAKGWHGWRAKLRREMIRLPSQVDLREYTSDAALDPTHPRPRHYLADLVPEGSAETDGIGRCVSLPSSPPTTKSASSLGV